MRAVAAFPVRVGVSGTAENGRRLMQVHSLVWNWEELGRTKISFDVGFSGSTTHKIQRQVILKRMAVSTPEKQGQLS